MVVLAWGFPSGWRPQLGRWWHRRSQLRGWLSNLGRIRSAPLLVWVLHVAALWFWHLPTFFQAAIQDEGIHILEHLSFFFTALPFWWLVLRRDRLDTGAAAIYLFTMALQSGVLGALITFSSNPWYVAYEASAPAWGLDALDDQQLAGVIMWVPGNAAYLVALLWILGDWFRWMERRDAQSDRSTPTPDLGRQEEPPSRPADPLPPLEGGSYKYDN
jgi:putative membrane protein